MGSYIPKVGEYYFQNGFLKLRSKWSRRFKVGLTIGFLVGGMIPVVGSSIQNDKLIKTGFKYTTPETVLADYVANQSKDGKEIAKSVFKWSSEFRIDPKLLVSIIEVESNFDKYAISTSGAMGLMQVMYNPHLDKIRVAKSKLGSPEPFNIDTNIYLGAWVLRDCLGRNKVEVQALKCYNGSIGMNTNYDKKVIDTYKKIDKFVRENV